MAFKLVLQIVDDQDVLIQSTKDLEQKLQRRFSKEDFDMALFAAEEQLSDSLKQVSKKSRSVIGGTI